MILATDTIKLLTILLIFINKVYEINANNKDYVCKDFDKNIRIDGITNFPNNSYLIFQSKYLWHLNVKREKCQKFLIKDYFRYNSFNEGIDAITHDIRSETTFVFKDKWFWMIDNNLRISDRILIKQLFDDRLNNGIDSAMTITNPLYDNFREFDFIFIFKGNRIWEFQLYFFNGELFIQNFKEGTINISQINPILPSNIDSAFSDGQYVYILKDSKQFGLRHELFPVRKRVNKNDIKIEHLLQGFIEFKVQSLYDKLIINIIFVMRWTMKLMFALNSINILNICKLFIQLLAISLLIFLTFISSIIIKILFKYKSIIKL